MSPFWLTMVIVVAFFEIFITSILLSRGWFGLVGKLHGCGCVVQRSQQVLLHVSDRAAVLCKALQHKADMVGAQLHKLAAYYLGGLIIPSNVQQLAVGGTGVHQQIYDLIDGVLIVRAKPEQKFYLQRLRKVFFQLFAFAHPLRFFRIERISLTHFSIILISLICLRFWLFQNCDFGSTRIAVWAILYLRFWQSRRKILDVDQAGPAQTTAFALNEADVL